MKYLLIETPYEQGRPVRESLAEHGRVVHQADTLEEAQEVCVERQIQSIATQAGLHYEIAREDLLHLLPGDMRAVFSFHAWGRE
jgi:hypothetical protein